MKAAPLWIFRGRGGRHARRRRVLVTQASTPHAVRTGADEHMLCVYVWSGDLYGRYWFCADGEPADRSGFDDAS